MAYWGLSCINNNLAILKLPCPDNKQWTQLEQISTQQIPYAHMILEADKHSQAALAKWISARDSDYKFRLGRYTVLAIESTGGQTSVDEFFKEEFFILFRGYR